MSSTSSTGSGLISGGIKWSGTSDTDFSSVVEALVAKEERVITKQETWKSQWQAKLEAINTLDTRLNALKSGVQGYDERSELLSRKATSSEEKVATITNTSTASTGVYSVEVGKDIQEKKASCSYKSDTGIGASYKIDGNGNPIDAAGNYIVDHSSPNKVDEDDDGNPIDANGDIIFSTDPADFYFPPIVIEMGGKKLELTFDFNKDGTGDFTEETTMEELADIINAKVADSGYTGPDIKAEVIFDKNRKDGTDTIKYNRLVITGMEGGTKNHINISDPTFLKMDRNHIEEPVTNSLTLSTFKPQVSTDSNYTGHVNKTFTIVCTNLNGNGVFGADDMEFSWADTEGKKGKFVVKAEDWDFDNNCLKKDVEIAQGVKINFSGVGAKAVKNEAFTIDCQTPVLQKASDSGMAQTDKWVHEGFADLTSPVTKGGGVFVFSYAGEECSISVSSDVGLKGLADAINQSSKNPGVIASVINDGMGTATSYKLVLTGGHSGAENCIRVSEKTSLSILDCSPEKFEQAREASNSMCRIDGYPNDGESWIQRPSNDVGDVLDGIVINLEGPGETQITIQNDVTAMATKIKEIVEAVNFVKTYIKEQTKYTEGSKLVSKVLKDGTFTRETENGESTGIMNGNYGFQMAQSNIDKMMSKQIFTREEYIAALDPDKEKQALYPVYKSQETVPGQSQQALFEQYLEEKGLVYTRMADIGVASNPDMEGQYIVNESELTDALRKNPEAVIKMFTFVPDEGDKLYGHQPYADEDPRPRIGGFNVMMGYHMSDMTRTEDVIDDKTGDMIKPAKGITKVLAENYTNIISGINDKITREQRRIELVRNRLEDKFTRLETLLATLNEQSTRNKAQFDKLSSNS